MRENRKMIQSPPINKKQQPWAIKKQSVLNNKRLSDQNEEIRRLKEEIMTLNPNIELSTTEKFEEEEVNSICSPDSIIENNNDSIAVSDLDSNIESNHNSIASSEHDLIIESNHNSTVESNHGSIAANQEEEQQNEVNIQEIEAFQEEEELQYEDNVHQDEIPHEQIAAQNDETNDQDSQQPTDFSDDSNLKTVTCASCKKTIDINKCIFYSGHPYHESCIKCMVCQKTYESSENLNDYINITPGLFLCRQHYQGYMDGDEIPAETSQELHDQKKKNFINELFNPPFFTDEEIRDHPPEDILITNELVNEMIQMNKPYQDFIPLITFHFDKEPEIFDYEGFIKLINEITEDESVIVNVERGSVIIQIAVFLFKSFEKLKSKFKEIITNFKKKLNTTLGKLVVGNLVDEPEASTPNNKAIKESFSKPSMNLLQNTDDLSEIEIEEIKKKALENLRKEKIYNNWSFIFTHEKLFNKAEEQIRKDIRNNPFEMIIIGQTLIANKYLDEYEKIKNKIPKDDIIERFLYHGSRLNNHEKIVKKHFLMPGKDKLEDQTDEGFYGKGIYATDNLFYASMYSNGYKILKCNKKTYIICCGAIYNKSMVHDIDDLSYFGEKIDQTTIDKFGINHSLVGSSKEFEPISESEKENNFIYGDEFVFPNKYQIVPICSFTVMRKDHFILWKDENIENSENSKYLKDLSKRMEVNIYSTKTVDEALEIVRIKKRSKIKLITNGGYELSGKKLIEEARKITNSNFVCLVFAASPGHIEWVSKMENVLFTTDDDDFKKFAQIKMNRKSILAFAEELSNKYNYQFKINESELLSFPYLKNSDGQFKNKINESEL